MHDTGLSSVHRDVWHLSPRELVACVVVLCVVAGGAFLPHLGGRSYAAEIRVQSVAGSSRFVDAPAWRLDVNSATQAQLECLPGIGPRRAVAIIAERKKRGAFRDLWELCEVPGLPKAIVKRLEPLIRVNTPAQNESLVLPAKPTK